jgi:hypothetical protein
MIDRRIRLDVVVERRIHEIAVQPADDSRGYGLRFAKANRNGCGGKLLNRNGNDCHRCGLRPFTAVTLGAVASAIRSLLAGGSVLETDRRSGTGKFLGGGEEVDGRHQAAQ